MSVMRGEKQRGSCAMRGGARQKQGRSKAESCVDGKHCFEGRSKAQC